MNAPVHHLTYLYVFAICFGLMSCDEVKLRDATPTQTIPKSANALQATVTTKGLVGLIEQSLNDRQMLIKTPQQDSPTEGVDDVQMGPIEQSVKIQEIGIEPSMDGFTTKLSLKDVLILVPTRQGQFEQTALCRWRVQISDLDITLNIGTDPNNTQALITQGNPVTTINQARVDAIGGCALTTTLTETQKLEDFKAALIAYAIGSVEASVTKLGQIKPLEQLGLIVGGLEITRQSDFSNRRGQLILAGDLAAGIQLAEDQLKINMQYGTQVVSQAQCTPPIELGTMTLPEPQPIEAAQLNQFRADLGVSLPIVFVERLIQTLIKGGFMCRGLNDLGLPTQRSIAKQDVLYSEVGIDTSLLGEQTYLTFSPGALPTVKSIEQTGSLAIQWNDMTLELYANVLGSMALVAKVRTSARFLVKVDRATTSNLTLNIETLTVQNAILQSLWRGVQTNNDAVFLWTRRLLLIALGEGFQIPLPLRPGTPMQVLGTQLREQDIVLYLQLER